MKLLFDANLSPRLIKRLATIYPDSTHVLSHKLLTDKDIWDFAAAQGFVIVSKDTDFFNLSTVYGAPPEVVWLRIGNAGTEAVAAILTQGHAQLIALQENEEAALLIL